LIKKTPKIEYSQLLQDSGFWPDSQDHPNVSRATVRRAIVEAGYKKFRAKRRPKINRATALLRLKFNQEFRNFCWGRQVLRFSDECSIARGSGHNAEWVWRLPDEKWDHNKLEEVDTHQQPAWMVWASIWMTPGGRVGHSPLVIMTRDSSAKKNGYTWWSYVEALKEGLKPSYKPGQRFMQDNAPIHTAKNTKAWLEQHGVWTIEWPKYSPDLNPIEYLWWALKQRVNKLHPEFDTMADSAEEWEAFEIGLQEAWALIPDKLIKRLIMSMPRRLAALRQARGYQTKY